MATRTRPVVEQLEQRQVPSVFIRPARIPLPTIRHSGKVVTAHVVRPAHHKPGGHHSHHPHPGKPPMSMPGTFHEGDLVSIVGQSPYAGLVGQVVAVTVADGVETDYVRIVRAMPSPTPDPGPLAFHPDQLVRANSPPP